MRQNVNVTEPEHEYQEQTKAKFKDTIFKESSLLLKHDHSPTCVHISFRHLMKTDSYAGESPSNAS